MNGSWTWILILSVLGSGCGSETTDSEALFSSSDSTILNVSVEAGGVQLGSSDDLGIAPPELSYRERNGRRLFQSLCAVCHGAEGEGDGFNAFNLDPRPRDLTDTDYMQALSNRAIREVIAQGGRGMNKSILMPAYGTTLTRNEIDDLVSFVRHLSTSQERSK